MSDTPDPERAVEALARARPLANALGPSAQWAYGASLREAGSPLPAAATTHATRLNEWPGVVKELYGAIYDPRGLRPVDPGKRHQLADRITSALDTLPQWAEIQAAGRASRAVASTCTAETSDAVAKALGIPDLPPAHAEDPAEIQRQAESLEQFRGQIPDAELDAEQARLHTALKRAQARRATLESKVADLVRTGGLGRVLAGVAKRSTDRANAVALLRSCGLTADPTTGEDPVDADLVKAIAEVPNLREIFSMLGRMRRATHQRVPDAPSDGGRLIPRDVRQTDEIGDLLAQEWALEATDPDLFLRRWLDRETIGLAREGQEPKERGDVLILVDRSGSMDGERIRWARALAGATMLEAMRDGRRVILMMYAGQGSYNTVMAPPDLSAAMQALGMPAGGGTDTAGALAHGLPLLKSLRDPDVLVVTDGEWPDLPDTVLARLKALKARLSVVLLEGVARIKGATNVWCLPHLSMDAAAQIIQHVTL